MGLPAARVQIDLHICPQVTANVPHVGGLLRQNGDRTVLIGDAKAACVTDFSYCRPIPIPGQIITGSQTVLIQDMYAARVGDKTSHGGVIVTGCPTVLIGG